MPLSNLAMLDSVSAVAVNLSKTHKVRCALHVFGISLKLANSGGLSERTPDGYSFTGDASAGGIAGFPFHYHALPAAVPFSPYSIPFRTSYLVMPEHLSFPFLPHWMFPVYGKSRHLSGRTVSLGCRHYCLAE